MNLVGNVAFHPKRKRAVFILEPLLVLITSYLPMVGVAP